MIKVGDRVKFISDTGEGIVRSVSKGIAQVEVDGFEIPALVSDIVRVEAEEEKQVRMRIGPSEGSGSKRVAPKSNKPTYGRVTFEDDFEDEPIDISALKRSYAAGQKASVADQSAQAPVVVEPPFTLKDYTSLLVFVPTEKNRLPEDCDLEMYLVNDSTYRIFYSIGRWERGEYLSTMACGELEDDTKILIRKFKRAELANVMNLQISLLPFKHTSYTPQAVSQINMELHPLKFVRPHSYVENDFFDLPSVVFTLETNQK